MVDKFMIVLLALCALGNAIFAGLCILTGAWVQASLHLMSGGIQFGLAHWMHEIVREDG